MSVSLSYTSVAPVSDAVRTAILSAAERANTSRDWWCEAINVFDAQESDGRLHGDTKLFLLGYETADGDFVEVDPMDDCIMVSRDARYILNCLAEWSREHQIAWDLVNAGASIGRIQDGAIPAGALETFSQMLEVFGLSPESPDLENRTMEISRRYASRKD